MTSEYYVLFNMMPGVGPVRMRSMIDALGSIEAVFGASVEELTQVPKVGAVMARKIVELRGAIDPIAELDRAERFGAHIITPMDGVYPEALRSIHDPPLALYVWGDLLKADRHAIAMVGTRRASHYGAQVADRLAFQLAKLGYTVVSGLARGIDTASHAGALKGGGRTLAVLGGALDHLYPPENRELAEKIAAQGAVMSEFPFGTAPNRTTFPMRNRIVSGCSQGVLVVEAAPGSGAMITADEAAAQGRLIFAVPGRIDAPGARGCHQLLKAGAKLVEDVDDITEEFEYLIPPKPSGREDPEVVARPVVITEDEQRILATLEKGEVGVDLVIRESGLPGGRVSALLIGLEMKRLVRMLPGRLVEKSFK